MKNQFTPKIIKLLLENLMLISILICVTICILVKAYFYGYYISPDSASYLRAAREILRGNGFYVYPEWFGVWPGNGFYIYPEWFGVWPIGYPFLIAVTSFVTRTEIYLASKILSIIIVWAIGITLCKRFGRAAWTYALVMFNTGFLTIFYFTWSEVPFILGLVLFSFWVSDVIVEDIVKVSQYIKLTFGVLFLFLSRYVGAFSIGVVGLLWLYNMYLACKNKDENAKKRVMYLTASGAFSGIFILTYLLINRHMTGYMTGKAKDPVSNYKELLINLYNEQLTEMNNVFNTFFKIVSNNALAFPLWIAFAAFVLYISFRNFNSIKACEKDIITPLVFVSMGIIYWCAIVAMRFSARFDYFSYRLLFPSSALLFIGFIGLLTRNKGFKSFLTKLGGITYKDNTPKITKILVAGCLCFFIITTQVLIPRVSTSSYLGYREMRQSMLSSHTNISDGATVLWGELSVLFLLDNVAYEHDVIPGNGDLESFFEARKDYSEIYIYIPGMKERISNNLNGNKALLEFFEQYLDSKETMVRIK